VQNEATTLEGSLELVRTIGRGAPRDSARQRDGSRYYAGEVIADKYRLGTLIARGGMGEVWLATHESLKTEVAIKFSDDGVRSDPHRSATILERFLFEARVSARLGARTKHIVAVLDAGTYDDVPYLVMEYVKGRTLDEEISKHGPVPPARMADIIDQIADALDVAHGLGVIHRDLKPANVMLTDDHQGLTVKVADFGVAKIVRADLALDRPKETPPNSIIGSPAYMSPEQMRTAGPVDIRSDLWSLGILVYETLTVHLPFGGKTMADLIVAIATKEPQPLAEHRPELGKTFDAWMARAIAKDPARRFSSAREMAQAFRSCVTKTQARQPRTLFVPGLLAAGSLALAIAIFLFFKLALTLPADAPSPSSQASAPTLLSSSPVPLVEPLGPPALPSADSAPSAALGVAGHNEPTVNAAHSSMPVTPATPATPAASAAPATSGTPAVEPSASADSNTPRKGTTSTSKPKLPPKEFDRSEIQ